MNALARVGIGIGGSIAAGTIGGIAAGMLGDEHETAKRAIAAGTTVAIAGSMLPALFGLGSGGAVGATLLTSAAAGIGTAFLAHRAGEALATHGNDLLRQSGLGKPISMAPGVPHWGN